MQNQLSSFNFNQSHIRVVTQNNEPWFVAKDVAESVDYIWKGTSGSIKHVPEEWRGVCSVQTPSGKQDMAVLSEAGLFFFLNRSDKPKALPFQKWVAGEVLPSIRRTGSYTAPAATEAVPQAYVSLADHLAMAEENGELRDEVAALKDEVLDLYRERHTPRSTTERVVHKVPVAAIELMLRHGIPRDEVAAVSGRSRGCLRVHIHYAKKAGRLN